jgi:mannose PTS system EIIA component
VVGIVLCTHRGVAPAILAAVEDALGACEGVVALALQPDARRDVSFSALESAVRSVDQGQGVLVLVDTFGGTPSNLAMALLASLPIEVITGINLSMAIRAVQKRGELPLKALASESVAYARRNISWASDSLRPGASG